MKRLATAALAALTFAAPLAIAPSAAADPPRHERHWRDRDHDDRRDYRREHRREARWDDRRYNGYYRGDRWYYGPPPRYYDDVRYEYRQWRRGDRLPSYYRDRYVVVRDYERYHLQRPPRGYHYVRDDRGDYLLVGIATGVILGAILSGN
jgi:Ni/Co efflux regulator RcnB